MKDYKHKKACSALICWRDKILFFHRDNKPNIIDPNLWSLPGGEIEKGEHPDQTIIRELLEEVSYYPKGLKFFSKIHRGSYSSYLYVAFIIDKEAKLFHIGKKEGQEIGFFNLDEALKLKLTKIVKEYLIFYKKKIKQALKTKSLQQINTGRNFCRQT